MRTIKFRGLRKDGKGWVYGFYYKCGEQTEIIEILEGIYSDFHEVDPATVGQYTGLKDKNGKEIFEGDIFEWEFYYPGREDESGSDFVGKGEVVFHRGVFCIDEWEYIGALAFLFDQYDECPDEEDKVKFEVIGNKHEEAR